MARQGEAEPASSIVLSLVSLMAEINIMKRIMANIIDFVQGNSNI